MSQPPFPPPFDPNDPNTWKQQPNQNNPYGQQNQNQNQNPYGQPNPNPYQQNPGWQQQQAPFGMQRDLPNATAVLILGIISIVGAFCYGVVGIICGTIALILGNKAMKEYEANPSMFSTNSYNNAKAGRICAIVGLVLGILFLIGIILWAIFVVSMASHAVHDPWRY